MTIPIFLELVEMKAKTASIFPFFLGLCIAWYNYGSMHLGYTIAFFIAMFIFNMAVDIMDNYNDYKKATSVHDYKEKTNIIGRENLDINKIFIMMVSMIVVSALIGIVLAYFVGWPLLVMGLYCYLVGIFYSSGPRPLSSLPVGEFFSGSTMGFMITLISVYLNTFDTVTFDWGVIFHVLIVALPMSLWIANLMLANNISDLEEDELNNRYTIVHYLTKPRALKLFMANNVIAFTAVVIAVLMGLAPWTMLFTFVVFPYIWEQQDMFLQKQVKSVTFICAVKILAVGSLAQVVTYFIGLFI